MKVFTLQFTKKIFLNKGRGKKRDYRPDFEGGAAPGFIPGRDPYIVID